MMEAILKGIAMSKTPTVLTPNDVVTTWNVRKGKLLMCKIALVSVATAIVTGVVITIADRMGNG